MSARRLHAYLLLLTVAIIWGVAASVIKFTEQGISTLPFLTYRFGISATIAGVFFAITKAKLPKSLHELLELTVYGVLVSTVALGLLFLGLEHTSVIEMNLITATGPLITSVIGVKILGEHVTKREKLGLVIAMAGALFTIFIPLITNHGSEIHILGNVLVFGYVLANAFAALLSKRLLRKKISAAAMTNFGFVVGFISIALFALYKLGTQEIIQTVIDLPFKYHIGVIFMAVISGTLAFTLVNKAQKSIEIGEVAVFAYLTPVFGIPVAVLWLGEKINLYTIIGAVVIALGVFIAETKKSSHSTKSK